MRRAVALAVVASAVAGGVLAIGLSTGREAAPQRAPVTPPAVDVPGEARAAAPAAPACRPGDVVSLRDAQTAHAGQALRALAAFARPGGAVVGRFGKLNANGVATVFGILDARLDAACAPDWYRVQLPLRPNGRTGWVRARDVRVTAVDTRILVDLSERTVTLFKAGEAVFETTAAIGKPGTPTPTGNYYVNQRLLTTDATGPFGPGAIGISAFSPTLQHWTQGGPIAIHGTNAPHLIGDAVSFGCLRVHNDDLLELMDDVPEGTPVEIRG